MEWEEVSTMDKQCRKSKQIRNRETVLTEKVKNKKKRVHSRLWSKRTLKQLMRRFSTATSHLSWASSNQLQFDEIFEEQNVAIINVSLTAHAIYLTQLVTLPIMQICSRLLYEAPVNIYVAKERKVHLLYFLTVML